MEAVFKTILLATDGAADSHLAARAAADLVVLTKASLHVVHAWMFASTATFPYPAVPEGYADLYQEDARAVLAEAVKDLTAMGVPEAKQHLRLGRPADEIIALSQEIGADLVVAGSHGRGTIGRVMIGSVAEGLARAAGSPVLIVRGGDQDWPPERVVVGDDGSDEAMDAAELGFRIGNLFDASCLLVHVVPDAPVRARRDVIQFEELLERTRTIVEERADSLEQRIGFRPQTLVRTGDPASELVAVASESAAPLVAVGKRGLGRIARLRMGSVSTKVLRAAPVPALIGAHRDS